MSVAACPLTKISDQWKINLLKLEPFMESVQGCWNNQEALLSSFNHFTSQKYNTAT